MTNDRDKLCNLLPEIDKSCAKEVTALLNKLANCICTSNPQPPIGDPQPPVGDPDPNDKDDYCNMEVCYTAVEVSRNFRLVCADGSVVWEAPDILVNEVTCEAVSIPKDCYPVEVEVDVVSSSSSQTSSSSAGGPCVCNVSYACGFTVPDNFQIIGSGSSAPIWQSGCVTTPTTESDSFEIADDEFPVYLRVLQNCAGVSQSYYGLQTSWSFSMSGCLNYSASSPAPSANGLFVRFDAPDSGGQALDPSLPGYLQ